MLPEFLFTLIVWLPTEPIPTVAVVRNDFSSFKECADFIVANISVDKHNSFACIRVMPERKA